MGLSFFLFTRPLLPPGPYPLDPFSIDAHPHAGPCSLGSRFCVIDQTAQGAPLSRRRRRALLGPAAPIGRASTRHGTRRTRPGQWVVTRPPRPTPAPTALIDPPNPPPNPQGPASARRACGGGHGRSARGPKQAGRWVSSGTGGVARRLRKLQFVPVPIGSAPRPIPMADATTQPNGPEGARRPASAPTTTSPPVRITDRSVGRPPNEDGRASS